MIKRYLWHTRYLLLLLSMVSGCAQLQTIKNPQIPTASIASVQIQSLRPGSADLIVKLTIDNPNAFTIEATAIDLDIIFAQTKIASVNTDQSTRIRSGGRQLVTLPVTVHLSKAAKQVDSIAEQLENSFEITYQVDGQIEVNVPVLGKRTLDINHEDKLPVPKLPRILIRDIALQKFGFATIGLTLQLEVTNPNQFAIKIDESNYSLSSNNQQLIQSQIPELQLDAGEQTQISLPIKLSTGQLGRQLLQLITNFERLVFDLKGQSIIRSDLPVWETTRFDFNSQTN